VSLVQVSVSVRNCAVGEFGKFVARLIKIDFLFFTENISFCTLFLGCV